MKFYWLLKVFLILLSEILKVITILNDGTSLISQTISSKINKSNKNNDWKDIRYENVRLL